MRLGGKKGTVTKDVWLNFLIGEGSHSCFNVKKFISKQRNPGK